MSKVHVRRNDSKQVVARYRGSVFYMTEPDAIKLANQIIDTIENAEEDS